MTENERNLRVAAEALLAQGQNPTQERIRAVIATFRKSFPISDSEAEIIARDFETRHGVTMTLGSVLVEENYQPWLDGVRSKIDPYYWVRYRKLLIQNEFTGQVIASLDSVTERILDLLENPYKEGQWDRRGMVVGHVQSGKTANYTGLICKAADAGYKLIIVIAGIHNNLRNQTQIRIDEGFVGFDSSRLLCASNDSILGVGHFDSRRRPVTFTNSRRDFNRDIATGVGISLQNLTEPAVFVIKKNSSTLKYLLEWLKEHNARHGTESISDPMLLIDDEADNASINVRYGREGVSRINGQIRGLLQMFERSCYIGYTATPFANIFIDPDSDEQMLGEDLFPKNFIVSLDPPSNYFGASRVFLDDSDSIIRHIDDNEDILPLKHPKGFQVNGLPQSLVDAIRSFVVARAIRLVRGQEKKHSSMLVNASRFTDVQRQLRNEIHRKIDDILSNVRLYCALPIEQALRSQELAELHRICETEYPNFGFEWPEIQKRLLEAAAPIRVVEVNSRSSGALNYSDHEKDGLNVIAVGGFSLSRGLTLEGLMVSYFLRNSIMYDTLMQMGRWFGYRPGYDDLCRVWMPEEAEGWYVHVTESIEMLRDELRSMEAASATPKEFGLKVRAHPETLIVTARNKMGSCERVVVKIGLGNSFVETAILKGDQESLERNRNGVRGFVQSLSDLGFPLKNATAVSGGWLIGKAPIQPVIDFISQFKNHPGSMLTDPIPVANYIDERKGDELGKCDILFASLSRENKITMVDNSLGITINCQQRTAGKKSDIKTIRITEKQRVASRGFEKIGLTKEEIFEAESDYRENSKKSGQRKGLNYPDRAYRKYRKRPLLIVHLLNVTSPDSGEGLFKDPVIAWSLSLPPTHREEDRVEFLVNTTWLRENYLEDLDEDEIGGDD